MNIRSICPDVSAETLRLDLVDMVQRGLLLKIGTKKGHVLYHQGVAQLISQLLPNPDLGYPRRNQDAPWPHVHLRIEMENE